eukprot:TRINITY_DN81048_c0_g1_i1.p1 TRINITY_DN81048_c0_g1~~TRINITY_DN81048_c0_g1_i1.p1  ORF type:complete len:424 (-),score=135.16 TRINITY_DN81048_c0_g1_i1:20-1291(-)
MEKLCATSVCLLELLSNDEVQNLWQFPTLSETMKQFVVDLLTPKSRIPTHQSSSSDEIEEERGTVENIWVRASGRKIITQFEGFHIYVSFELCSEAQHPVKGYAVALFSQFLLPESLPKVSFALLEAFIASGHQTTSLLEAYLGFMSSLKIEDVNIPSAFRTRSRQVEEFRTLVKPFFQVFPMEAYGENVALLWHAMMAKLRVIVIGNDPWDVTDSIASLASLVSHRWSSLSTADPDPEMFHFLFPHSPNYLASEFEKNGKHSRIVGSTDAQMREREDLFDIFIIRDRSVVEISSLAQELFPMTKPHKEFYQLCTSLFEEETHSLDEKQDQLTQFAASTVQKISELCENGENGGQMWTSMERIRAKGMNPKTELFASQVATAEGWMREETRADHRDTRESEEDEEEEQEQDVNEGAGEDGKDE